MTVGTALIAICAVLVLAAWRLGQNPGVGTLMSFVGIGLCVDVTLVAIDAISPGIDQGAWPVRTGLWAVGAVLLALAASCLYASGLGASPYDLLVQSASRFGLGIPVARLLVDALMIVIAWLIGGAWGAGTIGLLILVPILIRYLLPRMQRFADGGRTIRASHVQGDPE